MARALRMLCSSKDRCDSLIAPSLAAIGSDDKPDKRVQARTGERLSLSSHMRWKDVLAGTRVYSVASDRLLSSKSTQQRSEDADRLKVDRVSNMLPSRAGIEPAAIMSSSKNLPQSYNAFATESRHSSTNRRTLLKTAQPLLKI
ncbi:uncharacterized protein L969DRAFT_89428 [Mixia osmundae IAM 14324]|uniref:uncharacterized protein n=1 Tax=Mixia osmundae (strain CBS 9802 / IAM 14324 / JCM 22182 / KY 12970) TaxID=764103 RepID=UPI0004A556D6|nr:uncharacterized protein L969DRAFT_91209 [Mixia osmundae IAM 14324]XP_014566743.1 uncharacterized protein L969DRAFT_89428 [Mixia osmundae IAM 14324]KEI36218.1 hypothetical protein L969DRAFT_91209 [Mixia osmundae IAM 14324]KEI38186.1 hypothetical protein L969DRAFT_89428 [Mixia osmundae IAM 14324]